MGLVMWEKPDICSQCGGECCKSMPGCVYPEQIKGDMKEVLSEMISSGRYTIDCWEGDPRPDSNELIDAFYIRPATKGKEGKINDYSWGGECTFLNGVCELKEHDRPMGCQLLEPKPDLECCGHPRIDSSFSDKQESSILWIPFTDIIESILYGEENGKI